MFMFRLTWSLLILLLAALLLFIFVAQVSLHQVCGVGGVRSGFLVNESLLQYKLYLYVKKYNSTVLWDGKTDDEQDVNIVFREADDVLCCDFISAKKKLIILELINTALSGMMSSLRYVTSCCVTFKRLCPCLSVLNKDLTVWTKCVMLIGLLPLEELGPHHVVQTAPGRVTN